MFSRKTPPAPPAAESLTPPATQAAPPTSRRGFLKRLSQMGAALGLGIAGVAASSKPAYACTEYQYEYRTLSGTCGDCAISFQVGHLRRKQRRQCRWCGTTKDCSTWTDIERTCIIC
jgi:hypothetical protein